MGTFIGKYDDDCTNEENKNFFKYGYINPTYKQRWKVIFAKRESNKARKKGLWK